MKSKTLQIHGMTCAACAKASERAVKKLEGVENASVNFATEKMAIAYDETKVSLEAIKAAVKKAGYEAKEEENFKEVTIPIEGMT